MKIIRSNIVLVSLFLISPLLWASDIPQRGLSVHLQADCIFYVNDICHRPPDGSEVLYWEDNSGNNNQAIATDTVATSSPYAPRFVDNGTGNKPMLRFNSAERDGMQITNLDLNRDDYTVFIVDSYISNGNSEHARVLNSRSGISWFLGQWAGYDTHYAGNGFVSELEVSPVDQLAVHIGVGVIIDDDIKRYYYKNGVNVSTNSNRRGRPRQLGIANHGGSSYSDEVSDVDVAEIIIYERTLTSTEIFQVGSYLAKKYDLPLPPNPNRDSYTITFDHGIDKAIGRERKKVHLAVEDSAVAFKEYFFWSDIDHQPEESAWTANIIDKNLPYFTLKNLEYDLYLARGPNRTVTLVEEAANPDGSENFATHWKVEARSSLGDYSLTNRIGQSRLKIDRESLEMSLSNGSTIYDAQFLFSIQERFTNLQLFPEDIPEFNDLLHLPIGLPELGVFFPVPIDRDTSWRVRRYKVNIVNHTPNVIYEFAVHPGFDIKSDNLTTQQGEIRDSLLTNISDIVKKKNFGQEVEGSIINQISDAYNNRYLIENTKLQKTFIPGVVWMSPEYLDMKPELLSGLHTMVEENGKFIKLIFLPFEQLTQKHSIDTGFLIKKIENGKISFVIDDPPVPCSKETVCIESD